MKKKFISGLALMAMLATPPTFTSCSEDDINTVLGIIDLLISYDDLANTAWLASDNTLGIEFGSNKNALYYISSEGIECTYNLDTENNKLTLTFADGTITYTIVEFVKNSKLVLKDSKGKVYNMTPITE